MWKMILSFFQPREKPTTSGAAGETRPQEIVDLTNRIEQRFNEAVEAFPTKGGYMTLIAMIAEKKKRLLGLYVAWSRGEIS